MAMTFEEKLAKFKAQMAGNAAPAPAPVAAPAPAPAPAPVAAPVAEEQAPKRRGRPPGSTNKPKNDIDVTAILSVLEKMAEEQAKTNEEIRKTCIAFRASIGFPE